MLLTSGLSGASVLLGVFFKTYSDASQGEIGILLMSFPFVSLVIKPLICSLADRHQRHQLYLILTLTVMLVGFTPFVVVPFFHDFYTKTPRLSWYLLVVACHIGSGALNVAWSLGDCLAVNMAQRKGTPFGRMRLVGTISWGVVSCYATLKLPQAEDCSPKLTNEFSSHLVRLHHWTNQRTALYAKICACLPHTSPEHSHRDYIVALLEQGRLQDD